MDIPSVENNNESEYKYIYNVCFYDNTKSRKPYNNMYYLNANDTHWAFDKFNNKIVKILYIRCLKDSNEYQSAFHNTKIIEKENAKKLPKKEIIQVKFN